MSNAENDLNVWHGIAAAGGVALGYVSFWLRLGGRITTAEWRAKTAEKSAELANARADVLGRDLAEWKLSVGQRLAEIKGIAENAAMSSASIERRLEKGLDDIFERLDRLRDERPNHR